MKEYRLNDSEQLLCLQERDALSARFLGARCTLPLYTDAPYGQPTAFAGGIFKQNDAYFYADEKGTVVLSGFEALAPVSFPDPYTPEISTEALFASSAFERENPCLVGKKNGKCGLWALGGKELIPPAFDCIHCLSPLSLTMIGARNKPVSTARLFIARVTSLKEAVKEHSPALGYFSEEFVKMRAKEEGSCGCAVFDAAGRLRITNVIDVRLGSALHEDGEFGDHVGTARIRYKDLCLRDGRYGAPLLWVTFEELFPRETWWKEAPPALSEQEAARFLPRAR